MKGFHRQLSMFSILLSAVVAQDPFDPNDAQVPCMPHTCTKGYIPVPKLPLKFQSSGCNSIGGIAAFRMDVREEPGLPCCHLRSACYQVCGMAKDACDAIFKKCNKSICDKMKSPAQKEKCTTATSMHDLLGGLMQCGPYEAQQKHNCGCLEQSQAPQWRKKVLKEFYMEFAPEQVEKADGLAAKVDSSSKMAALLMKLVQKYPNSIEHIADPSAKMDDDKPEGLNNFDFGDEF